MLIRFDSSDDRSPSASLWQGLVDWIRGSLATALGHRDFDDYVPYSAGPLVNATGCTMAQVTTTTDGEVNSTIAAGSNAQTGFARTSYFDLQGSPVTVFEQRVKSVADANSPQTFVGLHSATDADDVFNAGAIKTTGDGIGLLWNADETIDIVAIDGGTVTVCKNDIGVSLDRGLGYAKLGLRIEKVNSAVYRLTPCVNGSIARAGCVNVAATVLPEGKMRPVVAQTVSATTDPSVSVDWQFTADK